MKQQAVNRTGIINEILTGIVDRVTFHNPDGNNTLRKGFGYIKHTEQGACMSELMVCQK